MPKRVYDGFLRALLRDIGANYRVGARYLTVRGIASKFGVSLQTAQKGVRELVARGVVRAAPRSGLTVMCPSAGTGLAGKRIGVVSNVHDFRFNEAFCHGLRERVRAHEITVHWTPELGDSTSSLGFGRKLVSLGMDGVVALGFKDAALPFYHALREGVDLVADIGLDDLPILPVVQTDNFAHSRAAALLLARAGYRHVLVAGYYPAENARHRGFLSGISDGAVRADYVCLSDPGAMSALDRFFHAFSGTSAVFSQDYATNYVLASKFLQHRVEVRADNFLVYDAEDAHFEHQALPPVRAIAPSLKEIARRLADKLLAKWRTGRYPEPLFEKI